MNIYDLADVLQKQIEIVRYPNQNGRFSARFENSDVKKTIFLSGVTGEGKSPIAAINDYTKQIIGQTLVFDGNSTKETRFGVPELELIKEV